MELQDRMSRLANQLREMAAEEWKLRGILSKERQELGDYVTYLENIIWPPEPKQTKSSGFGASDIAQSRETYPWEK